MTVKMNPVIKKQWVEALRSGKYKQGKGELRSSFDHFCCLGVLCDLHSKEFQIEWKASNGDSGYKYEGEDGVQPLNVSQWAWTGMDYTVPKVIINGGCRSLDSHNDNGCTFEEIANAIEEQL